jgi:cell division septal protein FtsQ
MQKILSLFQKKGKRKKQSSKKWYFSLSDTTIKFKKRKKSQIKTHIYKIRPYFTRENRIIIFWSGLIFLVFCIIFLIFWPFLKVKNILITREDTIININQAYWNVEYTRWKNILFLDTSTIASRLQKWQNSIEEVRFKVKFPDTLQIHLKAYTPLFETQDQLILWNGVFVTKEGIGNYELDTMIVESSNEDIFTYWYTLNPVELQKITLLMSELRKNILWFNPTAIQFYTAEKEVIISQEDSTLFIFDVSWSIPEQIEQLSIYQKEWWGIPKNTYVYIDVRIPKKLFLCSLEQEFVCSKNLLNIYWEDVFKSIPQPQVAEALPQ